MQMWTNNNKHCSYCRERQMLGLKEIKNAINTGILHRIICRTARHGARRRGVPMKVEPSKNAIYKSDSIMPLHVDIHKLRVDVLATAFACYWKLFTDPSQSELFFWMKVLVVLFCTALTYGSARRLYYTFSLSVSFFLLNS